MTLRPHGVEAVGPSLLLRRSLLLPSEMSHDGTRRLQCTPPPLFCLRTTSGRINPRSRRGVPSHRVRRRPLVPAADGRWLRARARWHLPIGATRHRRLIPVRSRRRLLSQDIAIRVQGACRLRLQVSRLRAGGLRARQSLQKISR